jgi:hypothetical protein
VKWCKLEPDGLRDASVWMQGFGQFDAPDLDAFERFLAEELRSGQAQKAENGDDHDHEADQVDDVVHAGLRPGD